MEKKKQTKKVQEVRKPFLTGSPVDENTFRNSAKFLGLFIMITFVSFIACSSTAFGGSILRIGLPAGIQSAVFSISNVLIQASVNSFGSAVMAGNAAAANIEGFVYVSMNAFHQACVTFTSQNFGAREYKRVYRILWQCLVMVVITGLLLGNLAHFFGQQLLSIYITPESNAPEQLAAAKDAVATGMERLLIISVPYFLCGIMEVICGTLRGIGMSITPMVVSIIGACGLRILWIATVFRRYHEMRVLYLSYPVSWTITAAVHFLCFFLFFSSRARKV